MKTLVTLSLFVLLSFASASPRGHPINEEMVAEIHSKTKKWQAHAPDENPLRHLTHEQLHGLLGTRIKSPMKTLLPPSTTSSVNIPKAFDAREQWKELGCVHPVRN